MKIFVYVLITACFFLCNTPSVYSQNYSTLRTEGIKGPVQITEQRTFSFDTLKNEWVQDPCCVTKDEYNAAGNRMKSETFTLLGGLADGGYILYDYYSNGLRKEQVFYDKDNKITFKDEYIIDAAGNYVSGNAYQEDGKLDGTFKIYGQNEFGQWTKFEIYSLDGKLKRTEEYTYENNRLVKQVWTNKDGKVTMDMITKYNEKGEKISTEGIHPAYGPNPRTTLSRADAYDSYGNWIERSTLNANGKVVKVIKRNITYR